METQFKNADRKNKACWCFFFFNCVEKDGFFFFLQSNTSVCPKIPTLPRHPSAPIMSDIG